MKYLTILALSVGSLSTIAFAQEPKRSIDFENPDDVERANGVLPLKVGEEIEIMIEENPSTGFIWLYEIGSNLELSSDDFIPGDSSPFPPPPDDGGLGGDDPFLGGGLDDPFSGGEDGGLIGDDPFLGGGEDPGFGGFPGPIVGVPGTRVLRFRGVEKGNQELILGLMQPWMYDGTSPLEDVADEVHILRTKVV